MKKIIADILEVEMDKIQSVQHSTLIGAGHSQQEPFYTATIGGVESRRISLTEIIDMIYQKL